MKMVEQEFPPQKDHHYSPYLGVGYDSIIPSGESEWVEGSLCPDIRSAGYNVSVSK